MLKNYFLFAFRYLKKNPGYTFINITGLALGIASVLLIFLYVQHELSFDNYHAKKDRIYRLVDYGGFSDQKEWGSYVAGDPIPAMRTGFPGVADAVKLKRCGGSFIEWGTRRFEVEGITCTESNLFNIFSFDLVTGNKETVLDAPNTAVITRSLAEKIFGKESPVGKTISMPFYFAGTRDFEITGLMEDMPVNTHFRYELLISYESLRNTRLCLDCGQPMYVLLKENADPEAVAQKALAHIRDIDGKTYIEDLRLEPLEEIHFSGIPAPRQGNRQYIFIMAGIAVIILIIGCANYMNLATARFSERSKEIGIRKVLGAYRAQLARQFLLETVILTLLALPVAILLLNLALPFFNGFAGTEISADVGRNTWFYWAILGVLTITGLIAGSYPALFLSAFQPREVLSGYLTLNFSAKTIRKGLVVFQFVVSIAMIGITAVILQQLSYVQNKELGFDSDQIVMVSINDPALAQQYEVIKEKFAQLTSVTYATAGYSAPGLNGFAGRRYIHKVDDGSDATITFLNPVIDPDFLETMGISLVAGRNISDLLPEEQGPEKLKEVVDSRGIEVLINTTGVKAIGWKRPEEAIGQSIGHYKIVGVVEDFHIQSLQHEIQPAILNQNLFGRAHNITLRLAGGNIQNTLDVLKTVWEELNTATPLEYQFLDDQLQQQYEQEQNTAKVIGFFAGLSILVAGLGLFGLAAFITERRMKEIGIRKVLGATVSNIVLLLFRDFGKLLVIGLVLAIPVIYIAANRWLDHFAYRIEIGPAIFIIAGLAVALIALLSTGVRSVQAALSNPVDSIRQ